LLPLGLQQTLVNCFCNAVSIIKMSGIDVISLISVSVQALGYHLGLVCMMNFIFFKFFCICLSLKKLVN
jgi:hypothetical protein